MNFPDLFLIPADQMTPHVRAAAEALGLRNEQALGSQFKNVIGLSRARNIGAILFSMRAGMTDATRICSAAKLDSARECRGLLELLNATGYVKATDRNTYELLVPVFDGSDAHLLAAAMALNRNIVASWLSRNYEPMHRELSGLTAAREGVPYPALFSQIWHEMFGLATRELVARGEIEDPYGPDAASKGSVPALWRLKLDLFRPQ